MAFNRLSQKEFSTRFLKLDPITSLLVLTYLNKNISKYIFRGKVFQMTHCKETKWTTWGLQIQHSSRWKGNDGPFGRHICHRHGNDGLSVFWPQLLSLTRLCWFVYSSFCSGHFLHCKYENAYLECKFPNSFLTWLTLILWNFSDFSGSFERSSWLLWPTNKNYWLEITDEMKDFSVWNSWVFFTRSCWKFWASQS